MSARSSALALRLLQLGAFVGVLALGATGIRWVARQRQVTGPRKVMQFTVVNIQPQAARPLPPPPPIAPPKVAVQDPQATRVELKATDIPPPDAPPPSASQPAGGPLSLASEATGAGDAFNLVGNPGGRGILTGGGLGDGSGDGQVGGAGGPGSRYGWYYARIASRIEDRFRRQKELLSASTRAEIRVWVDAAGVATRVQILKSTGNAQVDEAIQSVVGVQIAEAPPADLPMPMVLRVTARRPQ